MFPITLTELSPADAPEMFRVLSAPEIYFETDDKPPVSPEALAERYRRLALRESPDKTEIWLNWVVRANDGRPLGFTQATVERSSKTASIAYVLNPAHWGRGIAAAAVARMLEILETELGVGTFRATVNATNPRSVALLRRIGFQEVGSKPIENGKTELEFQLLAKNLA